MSIESELNPVPRPVPTSVFIAAAVRRGMSLLSKRRTTFEAGVPPPNYIAGLGRGATGFTTRSDIGPARTAVDTTPGAPGAPGVGRGRGAGADGGRTGSEEKEDDDKEAQFFAENNYDEFAGYGGSLFDSATPYDQDDKEADAIWAHVDKHMDKRRQVRREAREREELEKLRRERPKIQQQFADLKKGLETVSMAEWEALPEIGDHTQKYKKLQSQPQRFVPVPDHIIEQGRMQSQMVRSLDAQAEGTATVGGGVSSTVNMVGDVRKTVLGMKLGKMERDSVTGKTVVDPKGYLTDLNSLKVNSDAEIGDIKKARELLKSVTSTNPGHGPGWIARARLEEVAGRILEARKVAAQGCQSAPLSEDVWLEAARLQTIDNAKVMLARAVRHIPHSVKVWLHAANLEKDVKNKKRVLRKALEFVPASVRLWKAAIELEEPEDARIMLTRAVECVPQSTELWLALAHLETYENARKVLNKARVAVPTDPLIWITAAKLEEAHGNEAGVRTVIQRAIKSLAAHQVNIERDSWLKEAEAAEKAGSVATCQAIVSEVAEMGLEQDDKKRTLRDDAEAALSNGSVHTARALYAHALTLFATKKGLWFAAAQLEKKHGTREALDALLKRAVGCCPQAEVLWLMGAKERWMAGDVAGARTILEEAFAANPNSEQIWLAAVKLESENGQTDNARFLLEKARALSNTPKVWIRSAKLERVFGTREAEKALLDEALTRFPQQAKLWLMRCECEAAHGTPDTARELYVRALKNCMHYLPLWVAAARLEENNNNAMKARALLEKARLSNAKSPELWLAAVRTEIRTGNAKVAQTMLSRALQECPNDGQLWAEAINSEKAAQKKARSVDALKRCDNDPHVILAVARLFWADRKLEKAKSWFVRALTLRLNFGDAWAYYYRFLLQHGTEEEQAECVAKCVAAEPTYGEQWRAVAKSADTLRQRLRTAQILKIVTMQLPAH